MAYDYQFIRAVAQLGSALVSGTRGPGFIARVRKHPSQLTRRGFRKAQGRVCGAQIPRGSAIFMTAEWHPRLRGGRSEGTNIPAAVQAFGPPEKRILF